MSKPSVAGGLCLTCKFDPDCIYEARSDRAILQCEQFEMGFRQSPAPAPPVRSAAPRARELRHIPAFAQTAKTGKPASIPNPRAESGVAKSTHKHMTAEHVSEIVGKHAGSRGGLIAILQDIQGRYGYLPAEALKAVATQTGRPLVDVYGVATFYHSFSLKARGKHLCSVCLGTACHVRGGPVIADEFAAGARRAAGSRPRGP